MGATPSEFLILVGVSYCLMLQSKEKSILERHTMSNADIGISFERIDYNNPYDYTRIHRHEYFELLLFEEAEGGVQSIDFVEYEIKPRTLYVVAPGQVHLLQRKNGENGLIVQFTSDFLAQSIFPYDGDWNYCLRKRPEIELTGTAYHKMIQSFKVMEKLAGEDSRLSRYKLKHQFALMFLEVLEYTHIPTSLNRSSNAALEFIRCVENNYQTERNVSKYAERLGIPQKKMLKAVKERYGKTPLQIIHEMLFIEVKRLLRIERLSFKEIAHRLNFEDQSSFSRFVRKYGKMTPTQLRSSLRL